VFQDLGFDLVQIEGRFRGPLDVLVAGCGTGQQAVGVAGRFQHCSILAIDLSLASLVYAARRAEDQGMRNITFAQADILELGALGRDFDIIECVGVLHHMESPIDGWRALLGCLRPGGVMKIGLYSQMARREIAVEQASDAWRRVTPDPDGLRGYRHDLIKRYHNQASGLSSIVSSRDFSSMSEFRDLLFHVQECRFSLPKIEMVLEELGLRFLGFELPDADRAAKFREVYPETSASTSLSKWHTFEQANPNTFAGMYQFWVERSV
jgi:ubiquinone/menaquinone biosynthesis C-methylase UbiE